MIFHTNMKRIKALFFNETLKRWHFEDIIKISKISRERVNYFIKKLLKENYIKRIKPKGKMPYYVQDFESSGFKSLKRLYAYQKLTESGFIEHLMSLKDIKTAVIFGSFSRSDWYKESDIDLFIYGTAKKLNIGKYETIKI